MAMQALSDALKNGYHILFEDRVEMMEMLRECHELGDIRWRSGAKPLEYVPRADTCVRTIDYTLGGLFHKEWLSEYDKPIKWSEMVSGYVDFIPSFKY